MLSLKPLISSIICVAVKVNISEDLGTTDMTADNPLKMFLRFHLKRKLCQWALIILEASYCFTDIYNVNENSDAVMSYWIKKFICPNNSRGLKWEKKISDRDAAKFWVWKILGVLWHSKMSPKMCYAKKPVNRHMHILPFCISLHCKLHNSNFFLSTSLYLTI